MQISSLDLSSFVNICESWIFTMARHTLQATTPLNILFYYKQTGKYALNVLAGTLDHDPFTRHHEIQFVTQTTI